MSAEWSIASRPCGDATSYDCAEDGKKAGGCKMEVDYALRIGLPIKVIGEDYEVETLEEPK